MNTNNEPKKKKRAKPFNAKGASIKQLEAEGWTCWDVESRIPHTFITRDAFGFGDILAMSPSRGIMLVQTTGDTHGGNFSKRINNVRNEPRHAIWLASGGRIVVHCWKQVAGQKERLLQILEITRQ